MDYFISDLHFGHKNILAYDNRPFINVDEHDEFIINEWNETVTNSDTIYILGDVSWYNLSGTLEIFKKLNGKKVLIKGNHDSKLMKNKLFTELFESIHDYLEINTEDGRKLTLCHYPIPCFNKHYHGDYHFYGHVHNSTEWNMMENIKKQMEEYYLIPCNMFNVGAMISYINYRPRTFNEIINKGNNYTEDLLQCKNKSEK